MGSEITDTVFIIRERAIEFYKTAYVCFIQAFHRVQLIDVISLLRKRRIRPNIIKELHTQNYTYIRGSNKLNNRIPVTTGIRQGDSLSPIVFNVIIIIKEVKQVGRGLPA